MFRLFIIALIVGVTFLALRQPKRDRTQFQEAAIARLSETQKNVERKAVSIKANFKATAKALREQASEAAPKRENFERKKFEALMEKLDRVWKKRRAALYAKMNLTHEQSLELDSIRREFAREREQIFSKYGFEDSTDAQMNLFHEKMVESERYYDAEVASLIGDANFKNLKGELESFNDWLETKSPTKVIFLSDW